MRVEQFLLRLQALTKQEYLAIEWRCMKGLRGSTNSEGFLSPAIGNSPIEWLRSIPFGDALQQAEGGDVLKRVCSRLKVDSFSDVMNMWYQFHVDHVEPISEYSLTSDFGKRLYKNYSEKVLCGLAVADSSQHGFEELVHDGDHVIIPEGTSAFACGLAICSKRRRMVLITSNGAFVRELQENPILATAAEQILVAGGELDGDIRHGHPASRGFVGTETQTAFTGAVKDKPGATVVISSVSGLLPASGPYAPSCPKAASTRYALLRTALENNVRQIIFIADHSKMRDSLRASYGDPIFSDAREWKEIIERYRSRITFVVTPPEELLNDPNTLAKRPCDRSVFDLKPENVTPEVKDYLTTARDLDLLSRGSTLSTRFFEVVTAGIASALC